MIGCSIRLCIASLLTPPSSDAELFESSKLCLTAVMSSHAFFKFPHTLITLHRLCWTWHIILAITLLCVLCVHELECNRI